jgi:hypothetical protein
MTEVTAQSLLVAALVGLLSGTHAAIWGMYKDAIHEGFTPARFARSVLLGATVGVVVQVSLRLELPRPAAIAMLFGLAYAAERGIIEVWKTFVREESQAKYFIPMQFSVRGVPVANRPMRLAAGALYVIVVGACLALVAQLDHEPAGARDLVTARVALLALLVGSIVALGGAWKDAPKEGFEVLKFFRSPFMTVVFAMLLARLTDSYLQATVAALGYERAAAETYKTFFFPSKPRGKFAGKPVLYPHMLVRRRYFVPAYVAICAAVLAVGAVALRNVGAAQ